MIIFFPGYQMYLAGCKEMYAAAVYREGLEIDHVLPGTIDKNTDFIIGMAMRLLRFMGILPILNRFPFHFIYMKCNVLFTFGQFVNMNISEHNAIKIVTS